MIADGGRNGLNASIHTRYHRYIQLRGREKNHIRNERHAPSEIIFIKKQGYVFKTLFNIST